MKSFHFNFLRIWMVPNTILLKSKQYKSTGECHPKKDEMGSAKETAWSREARTI